MVYIFGLATFVATLLGGLLALKRKDQLHLILGFSAGAVIGVAFFDLLPESITLAGGAYPITTVTAVVAVGFITFMLLNRLVSIHPCHEDGHEDCHQHQGQVAAGSLALHSFLDGLGIGLAFQVSTSVGLVVTAAVLAHDFSDGINAVSFILRNKGDAKQARRWLLIDATAPVLGILSANLISITDAQLGILLALFCGFFLYIGASDLVPESHHRHPQLSTSVMTILGATLIYAVVHFAG